MSAQSDGARGSESIPSGLPSNAPQPGEVLAAKYRVERVLGAGGMGVVVAARHLQLGQTVAVKLLATSPTPQPEALARFLREAQAAAALQSDHVVRIYDVGTLDDGSPFMVMELLRGDDLSQIIEAGGAQPLGVAVEFVLQACSAISEAHARGIVHRDLKPSNLFVTTRSDGAACIKVLDFGISKSLRADAASSFGGNLTSTRTVLGSPYYMSPEQVRDAKTVDERADIWALGVILYELLAGRPPFDGDTLPAVCAAIAADPPKPLAPLRPDVPQELEAIIARCLEKNPERRFRTVADLTQALLPFASREGRNSLMIVRRGSSSPPRTSPSRIAQDPTMMQPAETDRTMVSAGSEPKPRSELLPDETVKRRRPPGAVIAATIVGIGALSFTLLKATAPKAPSTSVAPSAAAEATRLVQKGLFHVYIDSTPQGADVIEGDILLGTTPLDIVVARSSVRGKSRTFLLQKHGYLPFSLAQGDSEENVRLAAALEPAPTAPAPVPTRAAPVTSPPRARASKPHTSAGTATPAPAPEPDIRMQR